MISIRTKSTLVLIGLLVAISSVYVLAQSAPGNSEDKRALTKVTFLQEHSVKISVKEYKTPLYFSWGELKKGDLGQVAWGEAYQARYYPITRPEMDFTTWKSYYSSSLMKDEKKTREVYERINKIRSKEIRNETPDTEKYVMWGEVYVQPENDKPFLIVLEQDANSFEDNPRDTSKTSGSLFVLENGKYVTGSPSSNPFKDAGLSFSASDINWWKYLVASEYVARGRNGKPVALPLTEESILRLPPDSREP